MEKFNKDAARSVTNRFVADMTGIIYNGLVHNVPKNRILRTLRAEISWYETKLGGISPLAAHKLWLAAVKSYQDTAKTAYLSLRKIKDSVNYQEKIKMRSEGVFEAINKKVIETGILSSAGNFVINEKEYTGKRENISEMIDKARSGDDYSPFYLSDSHKNCAKDHLEYESRVYYDENYEQFVTDPEKLAKIKAYIRNHNCMSVQEVTSYPILLCVRNNCKHIIAPVPTEEVLSSSVRKMQIRRKMIVSTVPVSQAESTSRAYYKRYMDYAELWKVAPNEKLAEKMKRTKQLYKKWARLAKRT